MSIRRWAGPLLAVLVLLPGYAALAGDESSGDHIVLRSGKMLRGRVVGTESHANSSMLRIETDFGQILVPQREVKKQVEEKRSEGEERVFCMHGIRVVQWKGLVERKPAAGGTWRAIGKGDRYSNDVTTNRPNDLVKPGDHIRTGDDGQIDLVPHKDVWIRIAANSEIEIPGPKGGASLAVTRGTAIQKVREKPRGEVYRVRTPSAAVDHVFVLGKKESFFSVIVKKTEEKSTTRLVVREGAARLNGGKPLAAGQAQEVGQTISMADEWDLFEMPAHTPRFPEDDLAYIPGGTYRVGGHPNHFTREGEASPAVENGCVSFEIKLKEYMIDRREVAAGEFYEFTVAKKGALKPGYPKYTRPDAKRERWPVVHQSWEAASAFAAWCGKVIPTEAQWEVAAHGGRKTSFPWGSGINAKHRLLDHGLWGERTQVYESVDLDTADVSPHGVRGMVSSAAEWCRDDYGTSPFWAYQRLPLKLTGKVVRGALRNMRLRWRDRPDGHGKNAPGFRCVVEMD